MIETAQKVERVKREQGFWLGARPSKQKLAAWDKRLKAVFFVRNARCQTEAFGFKPYNPTTRVRLEQNSPERTASIKHRGGRCDS